MTDKAIGSVHYIAPEQARGDVVDGKTDIYSVGVMLYEMLTGQLPFEADNAVSVAIMQLQADPRPPREINPDIPEGLEEITLKAMQKNPAQRYQSATEMLEDIAEFRKIQVFAFNISISRMRSRLNISMLLIMSVVIRTQPITTIMNMRRSRTPPQKKKNVAPFGDRGRIGGISDCCCGAWVCRSIQRLSGRAAGGGY